MSVADEDSEDHHHLPAVEDWPRGFGEASWWPFVTAVGAAGIYIGLALFFLAQGEGSPVGELYGPAVAVVSVGAFLLGLYGWLYHAFVSKFWHGDVEGHGGKTLRWGMILFLGTEVSTFGAGFIYYFFLRVGTWPPAGAELPHLVGSLVIINTALLVVSSFTLHFAHVALRKGRRNSFIGLLAVTFLLGAVFIGGQVYEYYEFIVNENYTLTEGAFASAFYGLTGLHGLHVTLGAVLLGILLVRSLLGQYSPERHVSVSTVSMYWHFVDVVWLFLVVVLYVGAEVSL